MAENEMASGAEHVLTHGTARTRAKAAGGGDEKSAEAGKQPDAAGGAKKIMSIEITPDTKGGGRHIKHKHHPPNHKPDQDDTYSVGDQQAMHDHLDEHMPGDGGDAAAGAPTDEAQTQTAPMGAEEIAAEHGGESGGA